MATKRTIKRRPPSRARGASPSSASPVQPAARAADAGRYAWLATLAVATLTFAGALVLFIFTLAPTVTFEDSGELIAAAYRLGVPHEPGYPLWTLIAHTFTWLPVGDVAYRVNLMSAVFTALAAALIAWATLLVIDECAAGAPAAPQRRTPVEPGAATSASAAMRRAWLPVLGGPALWLASGAAVAAGLLAATAETTWGQAIITEVYGLNAALVALLLLLTLVWTRAATPRGRARLFYAVCLTLGLGLTAHDTFIVLLPTLALYGYVIEPRLRPTWRQLAVGAGLFFVGLLPYLYLPLAAARHPIMDWGNAATWTNFWRVVTRHQYMTSGHSGVRATLVELATSASLLRHQWFPALLALAIVALIVLAHRRRSLFWLAIVGTVLTWPVITLIADFPVNTPDAFVNADNRALASVFYIPNYLLLALLMGLGAWWLAAAALSWAGGRSGAPAGAAQPPRPPAPKHGRSAPAARRQPTSTGRLPRVLTVVVAGLIAAVPLALAVVRAPDLTMHRYRFADAYVHNVFSVASPHSLVMVDRDQFGFPLMYAQDVGGLRPDVVVLDQELLRRSWYLQDLEYQHPALIAGSRAQVAAFLAAVKPFEAGQAYDGATIDAAYYAMIKSFVDEYERAGRDVYFAYQPDQRIVQGYAGESVVALLKARRDSPGKGQAATAAWLTPLDLSQFDFAHLTDGTVPLDRNVLMVRDWYGQLLAARAQLLAQAGETSQASQMNGLAQQFEAGSGPEP